MRIISGKHKGHRIVTPKNLPVRPTTDMNRETLFNILNNYFDFPGLRVLDLFAGTGIVSFEFASRGCAPVVAVDMNAPCIKFIRQTAKEFDFELDAVQSDVFKYLEKANGAFDIIFADPFYDLPQQDFDKLVSTIMERGLMSQEGMLIVEHGKRTSLQHLPQYSFTRTYGSTAFSFFEYESEDEEGESED